MQTAALTAVAVLLAQSAPQAQPAPAAPAPQARPGTSLTVYSSADPAGFDPQRFIQEQRATGSDNVWGVPGYGVVKAVRKVTIAKGTGELSFTDVAAWIDPTTVSFADLDDPATSVVEQSFQFDLLSPSKLLDRYVGQQITVRAPLGASASTVTGQLLSMNQGALVIQTQGGVRMVPLSGAQVEFGTLPGGLISKPTLVWRLSSPTGGEHSIRTTYQTAGMTWRADYNLVLDATDTSGAMNAWVTLMNLSGASYPDAELKLVAGNVQKVQPRPMHRAMPMAMADAAEGGTAGFREKEFFEYHLYTLPRRTDVLQNSTQQIALFPPVSGFKATKQLVLDLTGGMGVSGAPIVDRDFVIARKGNPAVLVAFENRAENGLGMPLPAGKVRVFKEDPEDGTLEFVGEDVIGHTPRNETVRVRLGEAFDVVGERRRTDFSIDTTAKRMTETIEVEVRNQKPRAEHVRLLERPYRWSNWEITEKSDDFAKLDAATIAFELDIPAEGKHVVRYTVSYTW